MSNDPPPWWDLRLWSDSCRAAAAAFPQETIGLFVVKRGWCDDEPELILFDAVATPTRVNAHANAVVRFAYEAMENGWSICGTFHTHPTGADVFSLADQDLALWAPWHVVAVRTGDSWHPMFAMSK